MSHVTKCARCGNVSGDIIDGECVACRCDPDGPDPRKAMLEHADEHDVGGEA